MEIFVRRLPASTTRLDLIQFATEGLEPSWRQLWFIPIGKLKGCEIIRITNNSLKNPEYHGLLRIDSPKAALEVINRLDGSFLKSKRVDVRRYHRRSAKRDRRLHQIEPLPQEIVEQRKRDRRRPDLMCQKLTAGVTT